MLLQFWRFKVNGYIFRGSNSLIFIFASHLNRGHLLKKRICSPRSKSFLLRVDLILKRAAFFQKSKQEVTKVVSFCINDRKSWRCTNTPKVEEREICAKTKFCDGESQRKRIGLMRSG